MRTNLVALIVLFAGQAHASKSFPEEIERQADVKLPTGDAACLLCHKDSEGGAKTATKPFALTMINLGLESGSRGSLIAALPRLAEDKPDSDGDGLDDLGELQAGRDPNRPETESADGGIEVTGDVAYSVPPFETGCGMARGATNRATAAVGLAALASLLLRRRRL